MAQTSHSIKTTCSDNRHMLCDCLGYAIVGAKSLNSRNKLASLRKVIDDLD